MSNCFEWKHLRMNEDGEKKNIETTKPNILFTALDNHGLVTIKYCMHIQFTYAVDEATNPYNFLFHVGCCRRSCYCLLKCILFFSFFFPEIRNQWMWCFKPVYVPSYIRSTNIVAKRAFSSFLLCHCWFARGKIKQKQLLMCVSLFFWKHFANNFIMIFPNWNKISIDIVCTAQ